MKSDIEQLAAALLAGNLGVATSLATAALAEGDGLDELYTDLITPAMHLVGERWRMGEISVADEHLATATVLRLLPTFYEHHARSPGAERVVLAGVEGERHGLGLEMAADALERRGCTVFNLGPDLPAQALQSAVAAWKPSVVGLSISMRAHLPALRRSLTVLGGREDLRVAIGGQGVPLSLREFAPWSWSLKELPRLDLLPRPGELLAVLTPNLECGDANYREVHDRAGERTVQAAALEAAAVRALGGRRPPG